MTGATHLDEIKAIFPDTIVLTIDEVARVLRRAKKTIYNEISAGSFPCKLTPGVGGKYGVSIIELARWLDTGIAFKPTENELAPVAKRRGRPPKYLPVLLGFWGAVAQEQDRLQAEEEKQSMEKVLAEISVASSKRPNHL